MKKINGSVLKLGTLPFDKPSSIVEFNRNVRIAGILAHPLRETIRVDPVDIQKPQLKKLITAANMELLPTVILTEASEGRLK
ncbi:hypothetical protein KKE92_04710 [Candidatus Micrarchaeota archaeon]|nr:hypothetical protein [Candidatus Micrarchaeota archaeon]